MLPFAGLAISQAGFQPAPPDWLVHADAKIANHHVRDTAYLYPSFKANTVAGSRLTGDCCVGFRLQYYIAKRDSAGDPEDNGPVARTDSIDN